MKSLLSIFLLATIGLPVFADDLPKSPRPDRYKNLYLQSAMTDPPVIEEEPEVPDDLPDWVLVGLSKYIDGVKVKIMNKKDRTRLTIPSKEATELGFTVKEIKQDRNFIDEAVVTLMKGGKLGEVRFDPKFLVLKQIAGAPVASKGKTTSKNTKGVPTPRTPPIPGRSTSSSNRRTAPPVPGSVPRPGSTSSRSSRTSGSSTAKPTTRRPRYIPRTK
ncbi:MAG: hypothetical protein PVJ98_06070 [Akkermansiaceae bacterium]|jgi:hypothetical protein